MACCSTASVEGVNKYKIRKTQKKYFGLLSLLIWLNFRYLFIKKLSGHAIEIMADDRHQSAIQNYVNIGNKLESQLLIKKDISQFSLQKAKGLKIKQKIIMQINSKRQERRTYFHKSQCDVHQ